MVKNPNEIMLKANPEEVERMAEALLEKEETQQFLKTNEGAANFELAQTLLKLLPAKK